MHEGDWRRWGSRGGRETLRRYGADWFSLACPAQVGAHHPLGARGGEDHQMKAGFELAEGCPVAGVSLNAIQMVSNEKGAR